MEIYEMIDLQDCPRCFGPSILEEEDHSYYVMCMDCGCQSASFRFENDEDRLDAAKRTAELWNSGKVIFTGLRNRYWREILIYEEQRRTF